MNEEQAVELAKESRSSIELKRDQKGTYSWAVKLYFDRMDGDELPVIVQLSRIDDQLRRLFIPKDGS